MNARRAKSKGYRGEVEVATWLKALTEKTAALHGKRLIDIPLFERNRDQTLKGGSDVKNPFGLAIEVKRRESASVGVWWLQVCKAAHRAGERPVLLYRANNTPWRARMFAEVDGVVCVVTLDEADFEKWYCAYVTRFFNTDVFRDVL